MLDYNYKPITYNIKKERRPLPTLERSSPSPYISITTKEVPVVKAAQAVTPPVEEATPVVTPEGNIVYKTEGMDLGNLTGFVDLAKKKGINLRITSGRRDGARTKRGTLSKHATGDAIDITPVDGETMDQLLASIRSTPELVAYMKDNGIGLLRETTDSALKRTGGTGYHLHVGKDQSALQDWDAYLQGMPPILAKHGAKLPIFARGGYNYQEIETKDPLTPSYEGYWAPTYTPEVVNVVNEVEAPVEETKQEDGIFDFVKNLVKKKDGTIDWKQVRTTNGRPINVDYANYLVKKLNDTDLTGQQKAVLMSSIIEESGGDPFIEDAGKISQGILQWKKDRYKVGEEKDAYKELDNQLAYILSSIHNLTDGYSWTHGGKGSGYMKAKDAYADFVNGKDDLQKVNHGFVWGYVRPGGKADSEANRLRVATDIYNLLWK